MRILAFIVFLCQLFFFMKNQGLFDKKEIKIFTTKIEFSKDDFHPVQLVKYQGPDGYSHLLKDLDSLYNNAERPIFEIQKEGEIRWVELQNIFRDGCYMINPRNMLLIRNDTIFKGNPKPIKYLYHGLRNHYFNPYDNPLYSEDPRKAVISLYYNEKPLTNLNNVLWDITSYYEILPVPVPLFIIFESLIPPPPPPPPPSYFNPGLLDYL